MRKIFGITLGIIGLMILSCTDNNPAGITIERPLRAGFTYHWIVGIDTVYTGHVIEVGDETIVWDGAVIVPAQ
jgi:hypothetical protein